MKSFIIPVFIPHQGCPHLCSFCNQRTLTGLAQPMTAKLAAKSIDEQLAWPRKQPTQPVEIAFYGGSFSALPEVEQESFLALAEQYRSAGVVQKIRLSTRPDCLADDVIKRLRRYRVDNVEIGVQSLDDNVLQLAARGHSAAESLAARERLAQAGIGCGFQLLLGLPGEDWLSWLKTVNAAVRARPDFVRIYPAVVLAGTALAEQLKSGAYAPLALDEAVARAAYAKDAFSRAAIPVIRIGLQDSAEMRQAGNVLAGPHHPAFGELIDSRLFWLALDALCRRHLRWQGKMERMELFHSPRQASQLRGCKNSNIQRLQIRHNIGKILMYEERVPNDTVIAKIDDWCYVIDKKIIE